MGDVRVREALPADFDAVAVCMRAIQMETGAQKAARLHADLWSWQYERAPHPAFVVVAEDAGRIVGYYHVLLFDVRHAGRDVAAAMVQDVATLPDYRGRGVLREMGRAALDGMQARNVALAYTFPNHRSLPSFLRNHGYAVAGRVPVYVLPLDVGAVLASRFGRLGRVTGALASPLYRAVRARPRSLAAGEVVEPLDEIPDEVAEVSAAFAARVTTALRRDAPYLRWRFLGKPTREYATHGLWSGGRLVAYAVTREATLLGARCLLVMDLGCRGEADEALLRLLSKRAEASRASGIGMVVAMGLHPFFRALDGLGFVRAPERLNPRPFDLVVKPLAVGCAPDLVAPASWLITLADWDVV